MTIVTGDGEQGGITSARRERDSRMQSPSMTGGCCRVQRQSLERGPR